MEDIFMELKLSDKRKPLRAETRRPKPRDVVLGGIDNQLGLIADPSYKVSRYRYVDDGEGNKVKRMVAAKPRQWWFRDESGQYLLELRYGSSYILALDDNKPSILCGDSLDDVVDVLKHVRMMVDRRDLDERILALKEKAKRRERS
ncbi:DUF6641 family protein [Terasakiella pusilla]|uniref:DUF6641 family protein n=1 Tax=Terasakiella pusilla TaxID=64973 RepID=UPI003AA90507